MILEGVAWSYPAPDEVYAEPNKLRFAVLEPGKPLKEKPASYWRSINGSEELANQLATAAGIRSQKLTGFTLFFHSPKGWQMSVRREDEQGWDVGLIEEDKAQAILSILKNSGHPDGPWTVKTMDAKLITDPPARPYAPEAEDLLPPLSEIGIAVAEAHRAAQARLAAALAAWVAAWA